MYLFACGDGVKRSVANTIFVVNAIVEYLYTSCVGSDSTVDIVFQVEIVFLAFFAHMVAEYGVGMHKRRNPHSPKMRRTEFPKRGFVSCVAAQDDRRKETTSFFFTFT